ncbi:MAG: DUF4412 domain-containing protein [Acidobacteriia bacterium]|nr:DUF4412 domain-containing protein [Terriglobia bacterium]
MHKLALAIVLTPVALIYGQDLPQADTILSRYVEVTGGRAALEKRHNQVEHGSIEIPAVGLKGNMTMYEAEPNKSHMIAELAGIGKIESGTGAGVAWENNPLQGPRLKQGQELADSLRDSTFNAYLYWKKLYSKIETTGSETVEGHECYKVVLTPSQGSSTTEYFDKKSGLLIKTAATRTTAQGEISAEILYDDYRKEGDFLMPHKMTQRAAGQELVIQVQSSEFNVDLPKDAFDLPPEVQALQNKSGQGAAKTTAAPTTASNGGGGKFTIYMGGQPAASETYTLAKSDGKIEIDGSGKAAIGPMKVDIDRFDVVTDDKFQLREAAAKAKMGAVQINAKITFADGKAKNEVDTGQGPQVKEDAVHPDAVVVNSTLPLYPWTLLGMRAELKNQDPQQFYVYVLNQGEVPATVIFKGREAVEFAGKTVELNHLTASGKTPQGQAIGLDFWLDDDRRMIKIAVPSMGVEGYQEGYDRKAPPPAAKPASNGAAKNNG